MVYIFGLHALKKFEVPEGVKRFVSIKLKVLNDGALLHNQTCAFDDEPARLGQHS